MGTLDAVPTPLDVEADLKQIVHQLKRWEALPLFALRALPSVRFWIPPPDKRGDFDGKPALAVSNAAIRQCIEEAITRTVLEEDWQALGSIFTFDKLTLDMAVRQKAAAGFRGVTPEGFRKKNEKILLRKFSEEIFRGELEWGIHQFQSVGQVELDTTPPVVAQ